MVAMGEPDPCREPLPRESRYHGFRRRAVSRVSEQLVLNNKKKIGRDKKEEKRERETRKREEGGRY